MKRSACPTRLRPLHPAVLVALLLSVALGAGCSGSEKPEQGGNELSEAFKQRQLKTVDDLTPAFVNEMNADIIRYRELGDDPSMARQAHAARMRLTARVEAYRPAMMHVLAGNKGDETLRRICSVGLGFVVSHRDAAAAVPLLLQRLDPDRDEEPGTVYCALIGLAELGRIGRLQDYRGVYYREDGNAEDGVPTYDNPAPPFRDELLYGIGAWIGHENPDLRAPAVEAMGRALKRGETHETLEALKLRLAEETEPGIRGLIVEALANIGSDECYNQIMAHALADPNADVRWDAVIALARSGRPGFIDPLLQMIEDRDAGVRQQTIAMLQRVWQREQGSPRRADITAAVRDCLRDPDSGVRERAVITLGHIGGPSVVMDVLAKLGDSRNNVRQAAIYALGLLKDDRAIVPLIKMLSNRELEVRDTTRYSLVRITGVDLGDDPSSWQAWVDAGRPPIEPDVAPDEIDDPSDDAEPTAGTPGPIDDVNE